MLCVGRLSRHGSMTGAIALALLVAARSATAEADEPLKPNIVFLFADDLGYGDLACYGHPYARTPNLDRLASQGTRFTKFYVTGVSCCPSRTGIMTSKFPANFAAYPADAGFGDRVTVTELLKKSGYATGHFGKWHIGSDMRPGVYGFDATPQTDAERRRATSDKMRGRDASTYDGAIAFIEANKDCPFYVNVWGSITHHAVNPIPKFVDEFHDLVVDESDFPLAMREKFALAKARGGDISDGMRRYLGDVYSLDLDVGRLLGRLDDLGLSDNTIVIFSSDHGSPSMPPPGVLTAEQKRALQRNPNADVTIVGPDLSLNLMGFNGGLRGGKHTMYEGGVRVPFIIRWTGHVPAGRVDETSVISGIDWLPTLCAIAGVKTDTADFDGEDVSKAWLGRRTHVRTKPLFWKRNLVDTEAGIRDGDWKLIQPAPRHGEIELYDLATDPGETTNVAAERAGVVKRLSAMLETWTGSLPKEYFEAGAD